ncbi:MAG: hypothetical protein E7Z89_01905 [Cyanobacteria bacterium SIG28]|nr:hypothetical protein [Cyanobacteria bacterium SIG28]
MSVFNVVGKYLDQPLLVSKVQKNVPYALAGGALGYTSHLVCHSRPEERKKNAVKYGATMFFTVGAALLAPKIANKIFKVKPSKINEIKQKNTLLVDEFLKSNKVEENKALILEKSKTKVLNYKEVKSLSKDRQINNPETGLLDKLIPNPENITSKEIFSEIGRLSVLGFVPVVGGIAGGIVGDRLTEQNWKENIPNKVKEGTYQYLANIFLCNVGAGAALGLMEKAHVHSKAHRALGMVGGIAATGIIGGSAIANVIGNKLINPIFGQKSEKGVYSERRPEALDIGLHTDDIATVAVMSGLKWIEPALPIMYAISGYRAGIGYRNVNKCNKTKES